MNASDRRVLPGYRLCLGYSMLYLSLLVLLPLAACFLKASKLSASEFWAVVWTDEARAAYALTIGAAFTSALVNVVLGLLVAWVLVRYDFPLKRFFDAMVDLPFALPTAVAGLVFCSLYAENGWLGQFLTPLGIRAVYTKLGIVLVLIFTGFPFVVRAVQPVLQALESEQEEAAAILGASRWQTFRRVIFPPLIPAVLTGFALALARALGGVRLGDLRLGQQAARHEDRAGADRGGTGEL
jgi:sulfate transport system permease protein